MRFSNIKAATTGFLDNYKREKPATYAAAEQAIGWILIIDGLVGIDNPLGGKKRPGIVGSLAGVIVGIIFIFIPTIFGNITGAKDMTATTTGTIVSVTQATTAQTTNNGNGTTSTTSGTCSAVAKYTVNGKQYTESSHINSSGLCGLATNSQVTINYNPNSPSEWGYQIASLTKFMKIFFFAGILAVIVSLFTFTIRLLSIIFGWKILKDGRALAKTLPEGTDLASTINEIKDEFTKHLFSFGGGGTPTSPVAQ